MAGVTVIERLMIYDQPKIRKTSFLMKMFIELFSIFFRFFMFDETIITSFRNVV